MGGMTGPMQRTIAQSGLKVTRRDDHPGLWRAGWHSPTDSRAVPAVAARRPWPALSWLLRSCRIAYVQAWPATAGCSSSRSSFPRRLTCWRERFAPAMPSRRACRWSAEEMTDPIGPEFRLLFDQQNYGMPLPQALKAFADRIPIARREVLRHRGADAARVGRQSFGGAGQPGANHPRPLPREAAGAGDFGPRPDHWLGPVGAARSPGAVLRVLRPGNVPRFYTDPLGIKMIVGALCLQIIGVLSSAKSSRSSIEAGMSLQLILVLAAVFAVGWSRGGSSCRSAWPSSTPEQREIRRLAQQRGSILQHLSSPMNVAPWVKRFQQIVPKSPKEMSNLRRRLTAAGYRDGAPAVLYGAAEMFMPFIAAGVTLFFFGWSRWYFALLAAGVGFVATQRLAGAADRAAAEADSQRPARRAGSA